MFRRWVHRNIQADRAGTGGPGLRLAGIAGDSGVLFSLTAVRLRNLTNGTASGPDLFPIDEDFFFLSVEFAAALVAIRAETC